MSTQAAAALPASGLAAALLEGVSAISDRQLPTGEIGAYAPGADGRLAYRPSLRSSVAVHDALACFDPSSAWEETGVLSGVLAPAALRRLGLGAARIRRRIRDFLAWQEPADHLWREAGKHGGMPADAALSAAAALAGMDDPARAPGRWAVYARVLDRFRGADGRYRMDRTGAAGAGPLDPLDPLAGAAVAELLALAGEDVEALAASLQGEVDEAAAGGAPLPLDLACAVARCWARAHLPGRCRLAAALAPGLLERLRRAGAGAEPVPAGPVSDTARIVLALLDLGSTSSEIEPVARRLLARLPLLSGWAGDHAAGAVRCPSLTWALVLAAAARSQILAEEVFPCTTLAS